MSDILKYKFQDLVDIPVLSEMLDKLYKVAGIPSAIIDMEGNILTWSGSERICQDFYRKHPEAEKICIQSDIKIREDISNGEPYAIYECPHGLVDSCAPIIIEGCHVASVFTGQMLHTPLDDETIKKHKILATKYGYNEAEYLDALREVRVFPIEKHKDILDILSLLASQIAKLGLANLRILKQSELIVKSEEKYRELVEGTNDLVTLVDKNGKFSYVNHRAEEIFGLPLDDLIGKNAFDFIHPDDRAETESRFKNYIQSKKRIAAFENRQVNKKTDKIYHMLWTGNFHYDDDGNFLQAGGIAHDITEQKLAEKTLQVLVESTASRIGDSFFKTMIRKLCDLLGCECAIVGKIVGTTVVKALYMELDGKEIKDFSYQLAGTPCANVVKKEFCHYPVGISDLFPEDMVLKDLKVTGYVGAPILDPAGKVIGVLCAVSRSPLDLPCNLKSVMEILAARASAEIERSEAESARSQAEHQLRQSHKIEAIGLLAGGIAHDFNNILAAIIGNINLSLFDKDLGDKTKKLLSEAEKAALRAKDLTQQLLTFSKGGEPVTEVSSFGDVIKDSADFVLQGGKSACRYDIADDLWLVDIDKGQMSQVIQNIVLNASHAMHEGGIIKIICENFSSYGSEFLPFASDQEFIKISIRDRGVGMPDNVMEKIYDPYFTTKQKGSGLGLAITQSIINKHGGYISAESTPGVGSTFFIYLPKSEAVLVQEQKSTVESLASAPAKILIMDDEEMVLDIVGEMLTYLGHDVSFSTDGNGAIAMYKESIDQGKVFDLVIMDLTIPGGMGGKEAVEKILLVDSNAKVIVSSGYSNDPIMANFEDYGFCAAIVKPYQLKDLSAVVGHVLGDEEMV